MENQSPAMEKAAGVTQATGITEYDGGRWIT